MRTKAELIVISSTKFGENSLVLHTLSKEYGRRGFLVRIGPKAPMALFLPLNILEAEISENPKSSLWRAGSLVSLFPLHRIRNNIYKNTMTLFMSEVLFRVIREDAYEEGLYDWLKGQILALDALESDFANFHLLFLLNLCSEMGFSPDIAAMAPFAGEYAKHLEGLLSKPFGEALIMPLAGKDRNGIAEAILRYIEHHAESAVNVRSLAVLREVF